jgi:hypothetical protein
MLSNWNLNTNILVGFIGLPDILAGLIFGEAFINVWQITVVSSVVIYLLLSIGGLK